MKRTSKPKRRSQQSSKTVNGDQSAEAEQIDKLLFSSLKLWEVERELIEERKAARKSKLEDKKSEGGL